MTFDTFVRPLAFISYLISKAKEKRLGYKLDLSNISSSWINSKIIYEMDHVWKKAGLDAIGTNYFTFGSVVNGFSSRFNPESRYYQSWLGGYVVQFSETTQLDINTHFKLAVADQINWLKVYGHTQPHVEIDKKSIENLGEIEISGFSGTLYRGNIFSNTDVGSGTISFSNRLRLSGMAIYFNLFNSKLKIQSSELIPHKEVKQLLSSYQSIKLRGYIAILNLSPKSKAVLYANAAIYQDLQNKMYDNFKLLDQELLALLMQIHIEHI